jgi:hypothetical protein
MVFGAGRFAPETREGRRLIAHELTHVVQQSGADRIPVDHGAQKHSLSPMVPGTHPGGGIAPIGGLPDPNGNRAVAGLPAGVIRSSSVRLARAPRVPDVYEDVVSVAKDLLLELGKITDPTSNWPVESLLRELAAKGGGGATGKDAQTLADRIRAARTAADARNELQDESSALNSELQRAMRQAKGIIDKDKEYGLASRRPPRAPRENAPIEEILYDLDLIAGQPGEPGGGQARDLAERIRGLRRGVSEVDNAIRGGRPPAARYGDSKTNPGAPNTEAKKISDPKAAPEPAETSLAPSASKVTPTTEPAKTPPLAASGPETAPPQEPAKVEPLPAEGALSGETIAKELELIAEGRGRVILGNIVGVGGKVFAGLKIAGTLYIIYSLTQIRSLSDAGVFAAALGETWLVSKMAGKLVHGGEGPMPFLVTVLVNVRNDQSEHYNEDARKSAMIAEFLEHHFTKEQILANFAVLHREAENLLFHSKPFALVPTTRQLDESDRRSFEECMNEHAPAGGVDASEYNKITEACQQQTGFVPSQ